MRVKHMNASPRCPSTRCGRPTSSAPGSPLGLLLQDLHPPAAAVAAVREGAPQRRRPGKARQEAGAPAVAHRVPAPPCGRARDRRRPRRAERGAALGRDGGRRGAGGRRSRVGRHPARRRGDRAAQDLGARVLAAGVEVLAPAAALGFFDGIVPVWQGSTLHQVRAERHIAATGSIEQPLMFDGNDLPGVMLSSGRSGSRASTACAPARPPWLPPSATGAWRPRWRCTGPGSRSPLSPTPAPTGLMRTSPRASIGRASATCQAQPWSAPSVASKSRASSSPT